MEAVVRWSSKGRALMALSVPVLAWLSWYSFTTVNHPSPAIGYLSIGATATAIILQFHLALYRVEVGPTGIREKFLWGERLVLWDDVQKLEGIAQASLAGHIHRWSAAPEAAFHITVHTRNGRLSVHRWMTGVDDFVEAFHVRRGTVPYREVEASAIDRSDPSVKPLLQPSHINHALNQVYDGLMLFKAVVLVLPFSWIGGVIVAISTGFRVSGNSFVDGTLVALAPWGIGFVVYKLVERARRKRFGPEYARPPLSARDAILTMASAMGGPVLLYWFVPRAISSMEPVEAGLAVAGVFLCWIPIAEVRKCLRQV